MLDVEEYKNSLKRFLDHIKEGCNNLGYLIGDKKLRFIAPFDDLTSDKSTSIKVILDNNKEKWNDIETVDDIRFVDVGESGKEVIIFGDGSISFIKFPIEDLEMQFRCCSFDLKENEYKAIFYIRSELLNLIRERN